MYIAWASYCNENTFSRAFLSENILFHCKQSAYAYSATKYLLNPLKTNAFGNHYHSEESTFFFRALEVIFNFNLSFR